MLKIREIRHFLKVDLMIELANDEMKRKYLLFLNNYRVNTF